MSYEDVKAQLEAGVDPSLLCATCPWDRLCINPPTMTADEVKAKMHAAVPKVGDDPRHQTQAGASDALGQVLMTALAYGGRDTRAELCPVMAIEMRSPKGRTMNAALRERMGGPQ
jgi:hypothetical protein